MSRLFPDLDADIIPGVSAAGFKLGESIADVSRKVGGVTWYEHTSAIAEVLSQNNSWIGSKIVCGSALGGGETIISYVYLNEVVALFFERTERLYRISVGSGYRGEFQGFGVGSELQALEESFNIIFNDMDDDFLIKGAGEIMTGISFVTDYRASLEDAPEQIIQFISVHDWSLR